MQLLRDMGRWAQSRRRGGRPSSGTTHPPPPAPVIGIVADELVLDPQGEDDTGGKFEMEYSATGEDPWAFWTDAPWADPGSFGLVTNINPGFYRGREIGNGIRYSGPSAYSNAFDLS